MSIPSSTPEPLNVPFAGPTLPSALVPNELRVPSFNFLGAPSAAAAAPLSPARITRSHSLSNELLPAFEALGIESPSQELGLERASSTSSISEARSPSSSKSGGRIDPDSSSKGLKKKILIVDDDLTTHKVYTRYLTNHYYCDVETAEDGHLGVARTRNEKYDAIFMDHHMKHMHGDEASLCIQNPGKNSKNNPHFPAYNEETHGECALHNSKIPIISISSNTNNPEFIAYYKEEVKIHAFFQKGTQMERIDPTLQSLGVVLDKREKTVKSPSKLRNSVGSPSPAMPSPFPLTPYRPITPHHSSTSSAASTPFNPVSSPFPTTPDLPIGSPLSSNPLSSPIPYELSSTGARPLPLHPEMRASRASAASDEPKDPFKVAFLPSLAPVQTSDLNLEQSKGGT